MYDIGWQMAVKQFVTASHIHTYMLFLFLCIYSTLHDEVMHEKTRV